MRASVILDAGTTATAATPLPPSCALCGEELWQGERAYALLGGLWCRQCVESRGRTVEEE